MLRQTVKIFLNKKRIVNPASRLIYLKSTSMNTKLIFIALLLLTSFYACLPAGKDKIETEKTQSLCQEEGREFYSIDSVYSVIVPDCLIADTAWSSEMQVFRKGDMTVVITQMNFHVTAEDLADKLPPTGLEEDFIEGTDSILSAFTVNGLPAFARQKHIKRNELVYLAREVRIPSEHYIHIIEISLPLSQFSKDEAMIDNFVRSFKLQLNENNRFHTLAQ